MSVLILYAFISIFLSFLCSILEAGFLRVTPTFIKVKKQEGKHYADELQILNNGEFWKINLPKKIN